MPVNPKNEKSESIQSSVNGPSENLNKRNFKLLVFEIDLSLFSLTFGIGSEPIESRGRTEFMDFVLIVVRSTVRAFDCGHRLRPVATPGGIRYGS